MADLTKQDVQSALENARNRVLDRVATRQDIQLINDNLKLMLTSIQQNQQILRQSEYQRALMLRRTVAVESRIVQLDQELRALRMALERLIDSQPERILMPVQTPVESTPTPEQRYQYNPTA